MKEKHLVMVSGGPDSFTLINEIYRQNIINGNTANIEGLFINFGQPYLYQELTSARKIAEELKIKLNEINIAGLSHAFIGLGEFGYPILRNLVEATYGTATSFARLYGATLLYHANIKEDVDDLPWLPEFFERLNYLANSVEVGTRLEIKSSYINVGKTEIFERASEMGLEKQIAQTWSCLKNEEHHCGVCRACLRRKQAFEKAGIKDETIYLRDK